MIKSRGQMTEEEALKRKYKDGHIRVDNCETNTTEHMCVDFLNTLNRFYRIFFTKMDSYVVMSMSTRSQLLTTVIFQLLLSLPDRTANAVKKDTN